MEEEELCIASYGSTISEDDLEHACAILEQLIVDQDLYKSKRCRRLRCDVQKLIELQNAYGGMNPIEYSDNKSKKIRATEERNARRNKDKKVLEQTALRAGRMHRLNHICASEGTEYARILDGVVEDGTNTTVLHIDKTVMITDSVHIDMNSTKDYTLEGTRTCYTCKTKYSTIHSFYDSLCPLCAQLNWYKRIQVCDMRGRICLVTGGRVKIGFQCCLKLLRCGSTVIATSRFPFDTACRFSKQVDFNDWKDRIHIYGVDLRDLNHLEYFCQTVIQKYTHLDVIINNACQTVRRPNAYYSHLMEAELKFERKEFRIQDGGEDSSMSDVTASLMADHLHHWEGYLQWNRSHLQGGGGSGRISDANRDISSIRDVEQGQQTSISIMDVSTSATPPSMLMSPSGASCNILSSAALSQVAVIHDEDNLSTSQMNQYFPKDKRDVNNQQLDLRPHHSWLQRLHEVSTPEVAEVLTINSIAPFVLISKLKGMMTKTALPLSSHHHAPPPSHAPLSLAEIILERRKAACGDGDGDGSRGGGNSHSSNSGIDGSAAKLSETELYGFSPKDSAVGSNKESVAPLSCSFIINVSSMEGKFYRRKLETHPHTNMAKAALNMMTRTSASDYRRSNIFMTAVDTGWINDENPLEKAVRISEEHNFTTPLDEVDAAARILDPVVSALHYAETHSGNVCYPFYGCFLKDYFLSEW